MGKAITNQFGWSKSRHKAWSDCERRYYLHYYESWGGWEGNAPAATREAYVLKNLESRYTWSGKMVHAVVAKALEDIRFGRAFDVDQILLKTRAQMRADFAHSKAKKHHQGRLRKEFGGLLEHELGLAVSAEEWAGVWANAEKSLTWWFNSKWPWIAAGLKTEEWLAADIRDFEQMAFEHENVRVFAIPDFAYLEGDGGIIVDWKSGAPRESYDSGLISYALYLQAKFGLDPLTLRGRNVFLSEEGREVDVPITQQLLDAFREGFETSTQQMKHRLKDVSKNVPQPREMFAKTKERERCEKCPFHNICRREERVPDAPDEPDELMDFR